VDQGPGRTKYILLILILNTIDIDIDTDTKYNQYSYFLVVFYMFLFVSVLILCNISQIATGVPYSESLRKKAQIAPILINIGRSVTCFRPVQSFDLLGWGSHVLRVLSKITKKVGVSCPQGALKH
jgi:hypothetical protein